MKYSNSPFKPFLLMHVGFFIYSLYSLIGKFAARSDFFTASFFIFTAIFISILFAYALIWQQVLKHVPLSVAMANKAATIVWGMLWGALFFDETITPKMILGAAVILCGLFLLRAERRSGDNLCGGGEFQSGVE